MSKLDWSKAGIYEPDPARAQRVDDFVEPDRVIVDVRDLTASERARRAARAEYHERHFAKTRRQLAAAAAKKKSHLEAWVEKQSGLRSDRKKLRQAWRAGILNLERVIYQLPRFAFRSLSASEEAPRRFVLLTLDVAILLFAALRRYSLLSKAEHSSLLASEGGASS